VSTLGFTNVFNIGGFLVNPGISAYFPTENLPVPEEEIEEYTPEPADEEVEEYIPYVPVQEEIVFEEPVQEYVPVAPVTPVVGGAGGYALYTVVPGDSFYRIARTHLGDGNRWGEIYELNRNLVTNPNLIHVGWQIRIPA
jgi:nucleoid-associated protein YgaU